MEGLKYTITLTSKDLTDLRGLIIRAQVEADHDMEEPALQCVKQYSMERKQIAERLLDVVSVQTARPKERG